MGKNAIESVHNRIIGKSFRRIVSMMLVVLMILGTVLTGCGKKEPDKFQPGFTDITFDVSEEELLKREGTPIETSPSLYGGTVYRFADKEFNGVMGSTKYMTDDKGNIACISWLYESDDTMDITARYTNIHKGLVNKFGESGNATESEGNFGDLWYFDNVHILVNAVITSTYKGLQVSYLKSEYSKKDAVDQKRKEQQENK